MQSTQEEKTFMTRLGAVLFAIFPISGLGAANFTDVVCEYAPSQNEKIESIRRAIGSAGTGTTITLVTTGITLVPHSSGLPIMTGAGGYIAGSMTGAVVATTLVTAGVIVGGTALTVELACVPVNHKELVQRVLDSAEDYSHKIGRSAGDLARSAREIKEVTKDKFYELMGETWYERIMRKIKGG